MSWCNAVSDQYMQWDMDAQELRYKMSTRELAEAMEDCAIDVTAKFFDLYMASLNASNAASTSRSMTRSTRSRRGDSTWVRLRKRSAPERACVPERSDAA